LVVVDTAEEDSGAEADLFTTMDDVERGSCSRDVESGSCSRLLVTGVLADLALVAARTAGGVVRGYSCCRLPANAPAEIPPPRVEILALKLGSNVDGASTPLLLDNNEVPRAGELVNMVVASVG
jgi:hypothetical protein